MSKLYRDLFYDSSGKPLLLTPKEAADFLRITPRCLANWRVAGKGPRYCKLGGIRYRLQDLMDFVEAGVRNSTSDTGGRND